MTSPFQFLHAEWPDVHEAASKAVAAVYPDPRTACFYARRALELAVGWTFKSDESLHLPYQDNLSLLIHDPTFKAVAGEAVFSKARVGRPRPRWCPRVACVPVVALNYFSSNERHRAA